MNIVELPELFVAYRHAKMNLQYTLQSRHLDLADFEKHLSGNLEELAAHLNGEEIDWVEDDSFLGGFSLMPRSIKFDSNPDARRVVRSDPLSWPIGVATDSRPVATFRVMSECSIGFHVLSALWISRVGAKLDAELGAEAYGNRIQRDSDGEVKQFGIGQLRPYESPYRRWQDDGLGAMRSALDRGKSVVAVTADVTAFYHRLSPAFLRDPSFLREVLGVELDDAGQRVNAVFVHALEMWSQTVGQILGKVHAGIPVGLPASGVVANLALAGLDTVMREQVLPLSYGRYVDDILLVLEDGPAFQSFDEVWQWLADRSDGLLVVGEDRASFRSPHLEGSIVDFENSKNKVFLLDPATGYAVIDSISETIRARASEWRQLPDLDVDATQVLSQVVPARSPDGNPAATLKETDDVSARKATLAIWLRDLEALDRELEPGVWSKKRRAFLDAFIAHGMSLPTVFEFNQYIPRILSLAVACGEIARASKIVRSLEDREDEIRTLCVVEIPGAESLELEERDLRPHWQRWFRSQVREAILVACLPEVTAKHREALERLSIAFASRNSLEFLSPIDPENTYRDLFSRDLARVPFRTLCLPLELVGGRGVPSDLESVTLDSSLVPFEAMPGLRVLEARARVPSNGGLNDEFVLAGLALPVRPLNSLELSLLFGVSNSNFDDLESELNQAMFVSRGVRFRGFNVTPPSSEGPIMIGDGGPFSDIVGVAVAVMDTRDADWRAAAKGKPRLTYERYKRLADLLNEAVKAPVGSISYVLTPESSVPARWFLGLAQKLGARGINLIAGVEYIHAPNKQVRNQAWAALSTSRTMGSRMVLYKQDKQAPAPHEETELLNVGSLRLEPETSFDAPPVLDHHGLRFALVVCSELTNINYRAALRGDIDVLFVPTFNRDLHTFEALVESAALDIHSYIVQCNTRKFGDSRVRAPHRDEWMRDLLRVKGGAHEYLLSVKLEVRRLREFQSVHRVPGGDFKPTPDGFKVAPERKV